VFFALSAARMRAPSEIIHAAFKKTKPAAAFQGAL
jgi:hypothetical protein